MLENSLGLLTVALVLFLPHRRAVAPASAEVAQAPLGAGSSV